MWQIIVGKAIEAAAKTYDAVETDNLKRGAAYTRASILETNARMADLESQQAIDAGVFNINAFKKQFRQSQATARVAAASSGIVVNKGSALDVLMSNAGEAAVQESVMRFDAELKAYRSQQEAYGARYEATMALNQAPSTFSTLNKLAGIAGQTMAGSGGGGFGGGGSGGGSGGGGK